MHKISTSNLHCHREILTVINKTTITTETVATTTEDQATRTTGSTIPTSLVATFMIIGANISMITEGYMFIFPAQMDHQHSLMNMWSDQKEALEATVSFLSPKSCAILNCSIFHLVPGDGGWLIFNKNYQFVANNSLTFLSWKAVSAQEDPMDPMDPMDLMDQEVSANLSIFSKELKFS